MEEGQKSTSCKRDKKTTQISFGGGDGVGGLVVLGGALAVAGLTAVFAIKNRRSSKKPSGGSEESKKNLSCKREDEGSDQGLSFLSQTSSTTTTPDDSCFPSRGRSKMSEVFTKSLILEGNPIPEIINKVKEDSLSGHQEIMLSDDSKPGSIASCDDCGVVMEESFSTEIPIFIQETMEDEKADEASPIVHAEEMAAEDDQENDDEDDECVAEKSSQEHKQTDSIFISSTEKPKEEDRTVKIEEHGYFESSKNGDAFKNEAAEKPITITKETQEPVMVIHQPARSSKLRNWILCVLLFVLLMPLLLLSLTHSKAVFSTVS